MGWSPGGLEGWSLLLGSLEGRGEGSEGGVVLISEMRWDSKVGGEFCEDARSRGGVRGGVQSESGRNTYSR